MYVEKKTIESPKVKHMIII